jgi:signal transduction histidine kinase
MLDRLVAGANVKDLEVPLVGADGREIEIAWSCSVMRDDQGAVSGIVCVGRDLTERHQLERQLIQSDKMASLGVMAGGIAHELRNPLAVISVSTQLLLEKAGAPELRVDCLERINASTKRASLIVENLLKFARPQARTMMEVDVDKIVNDTFLFLSDQLALQQVRLHFDAGAGGVKVLGNPDLLQQVFTNLTLNACNAMPEGGDLIVRTMADDGHMVRIVFQDTGHGISPENASRVFDPFFTTKPPGGSFVGLGLSITYSIIKQHSGSIELKSTVGQGSEFTVLLPRASRKEKGRGA